MPGTRVLMISATEAVLEANKEAGTPDELNAAFETLQTATHKLAEAMYRGSGGDDSYAGDNGGGDDAPADEEPADDATADEGVIDAEYRVVEGEVIEARRESD